MTCDIKSSLHCTSTSEIQGLLIYFKPDVGNERPIFICPSLSDKECNNDNGVTCRLLSPTHAEIILSEHQHENGTFRCVMRGLIGSVTKRCRWTQGAESQDGTSTVETIIGRIKEFSLGEDTTFNPEPEIKDNSTETIIGTVLGVLAIILIMVAGYLIFRYLKSKRSPEGPRKRSIGGSSLCIKAQTRGLCKWFICADNDLNSQLDVEADATPTSLLSSTSDNKPNR